MVYKRVVDQLYESNLKIVHLLEHISLVLKKNGYKYAANQKSVSVRFLEAAMQSGIPADRIDDVQKYNSEQISALCALLSAGYDIRKVEYTHLSGDRMIARASGNYWRIDLPDPALTYKDVIELSGLYGFDTEEYLPVTREAASYLYQNHLKIYEKPQKYADMSNYGNYDQKYFLVSVAEWNDILKKRDIEQEQQYLEMRAKALTDGYFAIYQARENEDVQFMDFASISEQHMDVTEFNYNLKYADVLGNNVSNPSEVLERIYTRFNVERPSDFYGHSLSVSDVIVLNYNQMHEAYYCDSVGYQKLDNFLLNIKPQNIRIAKLTGEPVSEEMLDILDRCEKGEDVRLEEIEATKELKTARSCIVYDSPTIERTNRDAVTKHVLDEILQYGSYTVDKNGKSGYNGYVKQGNRLDIVLGLPASGKSSTIANDISGKYQSKLIDCDEAKKLLPEYNHGWGSNAVHKESQMIERKAFLVTLRRGENIVLPKVGGNYEKLIKEYIVPAREAGYKIFVHYVEIKRNVALGRMLNRFLEEGRFLDPNLIDKYDNPEIGNKIQSTYDRLKNSKYIDGYSKWNNDVQKGEKPEMIESREPEALTETEYVSRGKRR